MLTPYAQLCVLITGGAGFIGSHLAHKLVDLGAQVTILDNLSTGNKERLADIAENIIFVQGDITDITMCQQVMQGKDVVFHLAAMVSVTESMNNPVQCYYVNSMGTANLLQAAREKNVPRFVFSSSAAVYGPEHVICHEDALCQPASPYGSSKLIGEILCKQYAESFGMQTVCLRYFNVYGHGQDSDNPYAAAVAAFTKCLATNKTITLFGDGLQTRDFVPVAEVVQANLTLGLFPTGMQAGDVFNVATGKSITLLELIEKLKKEYPEWNAGVHFAPARAGDIRHSAADCSKYHQVLCNGSPKHSGPPTSHPSAS